MENFTNDTINTAILPKFEGVRLTALHSAYWRVLLLNWIFVFLILMSGLSLIVIFVEEFSNSELKFALVFIIFMSIVLLLLRIGFMKKGYAFRNHDVIYRHGVIATTTIVIPYNRVQHVAVHEGFISRLFGLVQIEIYTAGGNSSDIAIPGIAKEEAESIKFLLMGKIQKTL